MSEINTKIIAKEIFKAYPIKVILLFIFTIILSFRDIVTAKVMENIIGQINDDPDNIQNGLYIIGFIWLSIGVIMYIYDNILVDLIPKIEKMTRFQMINQVMHHLQTSYKDFSHAEMLSHINKYPEHISEWYNLIFTYWFPDIIYAIVICIALFKYHTLLGSINMASLGILYGIFYYYQNIIQDKSDVKETKKKAVHEYAFELFSNSLNILTFGTANKELNNINQLEEDHQKIYQETYSNSINLKGIMVILIYLFALMVIFTSLYLINKGEMKITELIGIILILSVWIARMENFTEHVPGYYHLSGIINSVEKNELFQKSDEENKHYTKENMTVIHKFTENMAVLPITFENVYFSYDGKKNILNNYNLQIPENEISLIYGPIGRGKTTILNIIMGFCKIQSGNVYMGNINQKDVPLEEWRRNIIYLPQHPILFNKTLLENLTYGSNKTEKDLKPIIDLVGYNNWIKQFPHGLQSIAGFGGKQFSGGQKQIIGLCRCLLNPRPIILLDEPTSSLDKVGREVVYKLLGKLKETSTVIVVSHDEKMRMYADNLIPFG
jgi:ABC-type bacteriocin/lantibiotic exporter with double-glycine peptidase domain